MTTAAHDDPFLKNEVQPFRVYLKNLQEKARDIDKAETNTEDARLKFLQACVQTCHHAAASGDAGARFRQELDAEVKALKIKAKRDTPTSNKVVAVALYKQNMSKPDRRRVHEFGKVVAAAIDNNVPAQGMGQFLLDKGGISAVMRSTGKSKADGTTAVKAAEAYDMLKGTNVSTFEDKALTRGSDPAFVDKPVVLLATQRANSRFEVHGVVRSTGPVDAAFASKHGELKKLTTEPTARDQVDAIERIMEAAVDEASS